MAVEPTSPAGDGDPGRLATRFHAALAESRRALGAHASLLPSGRIARFDSLLADFEKRRVRIAVYGEVKAGKSTLVNALAGDVLSPASFGPLTSVPVRITWGPETAWSADGQHFATADELAAAMRAETPAEEVTITTNIELLRLGGQLDLVDTPGVGSEDRFDEISAGTLRSLDAVILVVRYPALFTRFTRHLLASLEGDIGKLFVVWNLDTACAELSEAERAAQVEALRAKVAGVHQLYTVDARRAFAAAQTANDWELHASGLFDLIDGLRSFAQSEQRSATALREAAKRVDQWMRQADETLRKRQAQLEASLSETRRRLQAVRDDAEARNQATRAGFDAFRATLGRIAGELDDKAAKRAREHRKLLRKARRGWFWNGDAAALQQAAQSIGEAYANDVDEALKDATNALYAAAEAFGTRITAAPRERVVPAVDAVGPEERLQRATEGRLRRTRRSLRRSWYLPGLTHLCGDVIDAEILSQRSWVEETCRAAEGAAQATLDAKLAEIERRAGEAGDQLARDRQLAAEEAELETLRRDVPVISQNRASLAAMAAEARRIA
jgi:predicted GTPase